MLYKCIFFLHILFLSLAGCSNDDNLLKALNREIRTISNGRFCLDTDISTDKYYLPDDSNFFEVPFLPKGFFIKYYKSDSFPALRYEGNRGSNKFPIYNIESIYLYADFLILNTNDAYLKIFFDNPYDINEIYEIEEDCLKIFSFYKMNFLNEEIDKEIINQTQAIVCVEDREKSKEFGIKWSSPVVSAIIEAGIMTSDTGKKYLVGESIYSFFCFELDSGNLSFFYSYEDYLNFLDEAFFSTFFILKITPNFGRQKIKNRNRIECYNVWYPDK